MTELKGNKKLPLPTTEHPTDATVTSAMIEAGLAEAFAYCPTMDSDELSAIYLAMNAARTTPIDDEGLELRTLLASALGEHDADHGESHNLEHWSFKAHVLLLGKAKLNVS